MLTEEQIIEYGLTLEGAQVKYPYGKTPLVLATPDGHEFCELYEGPSPLHLVMKNTPERSLILRSTYRSVQPGYRCNKKYWNSVFIDGSMPDEDIKALLRQSYELSCKIRKKNKTEAAPPPPPAAPKYEFDF